MRTSGFLTSLFNDDAGGGGDDHGVDVFRWNKSRWGEEQTHSDTFVQSQPKLFFGFFVFRQLILFIFVCLHQRSFRVMFSLIEYNVFSRIRSFESLRPRMTIVCWILCHTSEKSTKWKMLNSIILERKKTLCFHFNCF